jgi:hypothetical protein
MPSLLNLEQVVHMATLLDAVTNLGRRDLRLFQGAHNYPVKHIRAIYKVPTASTWSSADVRFTGSLAAK